MASGTQRNRSSIPGRDVGRKGTPACEAGSQEPGASRVLPSRDIHFLGKHFTGTVNSRHFSEVFCCYSHFLSKEAETERG